jgi:hypothetical protein
MTAFWFRFRKSRLGRLVEILRRRRVFSIFCAIIGLSIPLLEIPQMGVMHAIRIYGFGMLYLSTIKIVIIFYDWREARLRARRWRKRHSSKLSGDN